MSQKVTTTHPGPPDVKAQHVLNFARDKPPDSAASLRDVQRNAENTARGVQTAGDAADAQVGVFLSQVDCAEKRKRETDPEGSHRLPGQTAVSEHVHCRDGAKNKRKAKMPMKRGSVVDLGKRERVATGRGTWGTAVSGVAQNVILQARQPLPGYSSYKNSLGYTFLWCFLYLCSILQ